MVCGWGTQAHLAGACVSTTVKGLNLVCSQVFGGHWQSFHIAAGLRTLPPCWPVAGGAPQPLAIGGSQHISSKHVHEKARRRSKMEDLRNLITKVASHLLVISVGYRQVTHYVPSTPKRRRLQRAATSEVGSGLCARGCQPLGSHLCVGRSATGDSGQGWRGPWSCL